MNSNTFSAFPSSRPGVVITQATLTDFVFPAHSHDHIVIGLVQDGGQTSRYGLRRFDVQKGDVLLVDPGQVHDGRPISACGRRYTMLEINIEAFKKLLGDSLNVDYQEFRQPICRNREALSAFTKWHKALTENNAQSEEEAASGFISQIFKHKLLTEFSRRIEHDLANRVKQRMLATGTEYNTISELALECGASRFQLIRAFKKAYGLTPEDFRRQLRVQRARNLLMQPLSLADIAVTAGFADQSHMTREFRRLIGLTPHTYRTALQ